MYKSLKEEEEPHPTSAPSAPCPESPSLNLSESPSPFYSPASPATKQSPQNSSQQKRTTAALERWLKAPSAIEGPIEYANEWNLGGRSRRDIPYPQPSLRADCLYTQKQKPGDWTPQIVDDFKKVDHIGEGTYGSVYRAKSPSEKDVALKKVRMEGEKDGFPVTAIRELTILRSLNHKNIVNLLDVVSSSDAEQNRKSASFFMVFEYLDHDLTGLLDNKDVYLKDFQIKYYFREILEGLAYCHRNGVLHRDMKGSNVLISNNGDVKLADFGLARFVAKHTHGYTNRVITLWYRPPELLLGATHYSFEVDMWSVGCVFAEMLSRQSPFPGKSELNQFDQICQKCGTPTEETWPGVTKYPWYEKFKVTKMYPRVLKQGYSRLPKEAQDLLDKLLVLDPKKRLTADQALQHPYFYTPPLPERPTLKCKPSHELQTKRRNKKLDQEREKEQKRKLDVGKPRPPYKESNAPFPNPSMSSSSSAPPVPAQNQPTGVENPDYRPAKKPKPNPSYDNSSSHQPYDKSYEKPHERPYDKPYEKPYDKPYDKSHDKSAPSYGSSTSNSSSNYPPQTHAAHQPPSDRHSRRPYPPSHTFPRSSAGGNSSNGRQDSYYNDYSEQSYNSYDNATHDDRPYDQYDDRTYRDRGYQDRGGNQGQGYGDRTDRNYDRGYDSYRGQDDRGYGQYNYNSQRQSDWGPHRRRGGSGGRDRGGRDRGGRDRGGRGRDRGRRDRGGRSWRGRPRGKF